MTDDTVAYMGWGISAQEQIDGFRREVRELKAENAKLRELVSEVIDDAWNEDGYMPPDWLDKELQELGIEVD